MDNRDICFRLIGGPFFFAYLCFAQKTNLNDRAFVMDGHVHMINRQFYLGGDITDSYKDGQVDLPRIRKGGLKAIFFSLFSSEEYYPRRFEVKHTMQLMDLALRQIEKHHDQIEIALRASDIDRINKAGKIAAVLDLEGGFDLDGDLGVLRDLYRLGLRSAMLPSHNFTNNFADSCCAPAKWNGVNERGRAVIAEMNRLGMVINVAHGSNETILQAAEISRAPVLYSHGGSRHFVDTPRNLTDEAARKISSKGGVVGLQFGNTFSNRAYYEWRQKGRPFGDLSGTLKRYGTFATIEDLDKAVGKNYPSEPQVPPEEFRMGIDRLVEVIDYWIKLVGEDHVSLGSDFDGGPEPPRGMRDIGDYGQMTEAMLRKGYSEQRIRKVLGLNLLRLFREVTEAAR
jgi:membrane dipeptidase